MIQGKVIGILAVLLLNFASALCLAGGAGNAESAKYEVWFRDIQLEIPDSFVVDLRYYTEDEGLIILRQIVDDGETGSTIGIALQPLDQESLDAFRVAGYSHSRYCEFNVFSRDDESVGRSKIVVIAQGFIQLTNLNESLVEEVLQSLCEQITEHSPK